MSWGGMMTKQGRYFYRQTPNKSGFYGEPASLFDRGFGSILFVMLSDFVYSVSMDSLGTIKCQQC
jgi:hypothetical protein